MALLRQTPWTKDEFMNEAARQGGSGLAALHEQFLSAITGSAALEVRFDGQGGSEASYNVYAMDVRKELLRVRASGKLQACVEHLSEEGQQERAAFYRQQLGTLIDQESGGWPWLTKSVENINHSHLGRLVKAVAFCPPSPA